MSVSFGLEFSDIYTRVKDYANINNVVNVDVKAKRAANDALRLIASLRNWEILKREATVTPVASTQGYTLASNFDHIISCWYSSNGIEIPIDVVDDDKWAQVVLASTAAPPRHCRPAKADGARKLLLSPRPSASLVPQYSTINYDYVKKPVELSTDTDVPDVPDTSQQIDRK